MKIEVYVANLGKYNEGELVGAWFTLPVEFSVVAKEIGLNDEYEEYAIHDFEAVDGIKINEYTSLDSLNAIAEQIDSLDSYEVEELELLLSTNDLTFEEALETLQDGSYSVYYKCDDMSDVAYECYEQTGQLAEIEKVINSSYIDWERIGRDMEIEGSFYYVGNSTYVELHR